MQLAPLRFTKIDGTAVAVTVSSPAEAKAALKELRHKKKELKFLRTALVRQQKAARARKPKGKASSGMLDMFVADLKWGLSAIANGGAVGEQSRGPRTLAEVERELRRTDEVLHNIEGCILQLQGKLLAHG